jgi:glucokinase
VNVKIERAVLGVAGPVVEGQAKIVNLSWIIEKSKLERNLKLSSVRLLNDLEAIANAVPVLEKSDQRTIHKGDPEKNGTMAVIAPGTGLGEAFLLWEGSNYRAIPSEGGHADFAPADSRQTELLEYLREQFGHVSCERVCSGRGIPNIYAFLKEQKIAEEPEWLADKLAKADDPTPVIVNAAQEGEESCTLCVETVRLFVSILAAEAGNLALRVLATGGVYLGGVHTKR